MFRIPFMRPRPYDTRLAFNVSVSWFVNALAYSIIYPFLPLYLHGQRGIPMPVVGLIFPVMGVATMVGPLVSGYLVDRIGRRKLLVGGPLVRSLVFFGLALLAAAGAPFSMFAVLLFLNAFTGSFFPNASDAYITDLVPEEHRSDVYGFIRIATNVGWMLGPMIGAFLARTPFALLFALTGLLCLGAAVFNYFTCRESRAAGIGRDNGARQPVLPMLRRDTPFLVLMVSSLALFMLVSQLYTTLSVYATSCAGLGKNQLGFLYSINGLTIIIAQVPLNALLGKTDTLKRMMAGTLLYMAGYFMLGFSVSWSALALCMVVLTLGEAAVVPALFLRISSTAPPALIGRYMGMLSMVRGIGRSVGPYFGALAFGAFASTPAVLWGILVQFGTLALAGFFLLSRMRNPVRTGM